MVQPKESCKEPSKAPVGVDDGTFEGAVLGTFVGFVDGTSRRYTSRIARRHLLMKI